jgi:flavin reductase (DIM6/NTAB) family NADH-FMN oxidoreductase RutF
MLNAATTRFFGYYPGTVSLVTSEHAGRRNIMSAGWHTAVSMEPALYGVAIGRQRATHALVRDSGSFGLNFLPSAHTHAIQGAGTLSLHDGADKYARLNLHPSSEHPLALHEAYLCYLCQVEQVVPTGDHDWFVGRVERVLYDEAAYDERFLLREVAAVYLGRGEYIPLSGARAAYPPDLYR